MTESNTGCDKKFNILVAERIDAIRGLAQSTFVKNCADVHLEVAANRREIKKKLHLFSPDLIVISENLELSSKKLIKWLNNHHDLRLRYYEKAKTDNFDRLIPPVYLSSSFSLSGINYYVLAATKEYEKRRLERIDTQDAVRLLSGDARIIKGNLVNVAEGGVLCLFPRDRDCPPIAEKVLIDLGSEEEPAMTGIPGFPVRIQNEKPVLLCETIQIAVKFIQLTEEHTSGLKKYISSQKKASAEEK